MAIYHLRATMISRSQGRSATAAIAYRAAERIEDHRTGLTFDYAGRSGVDHTEILAPDHAPDWAYDRSKLWNQVERAETRKNSQVAREVRVALPAELTHEQRVELVRDFAQEQFVDRGMVADIALHAPGRDGDDRNHHAHILLTTREIGAEGFTTKNRDWNKVELLEHWREAWALGSNHALERAGLEERIDHRTLEAQREEALEWAAEARERGDEGMELRETVRAISLDREPLLQLSPGAWQMKERGHEVGRVRAWHEIKAQAVEVARVAQELAGHVRDWLDHAAERTLDRLGGRAELALSGGPEEQGRTPDLATRLREAWADRQERQQELPEAEAPERTVSEGLSARLRSAFSGKERDSLRERLSAYREERELDERHTARELETDLQQERHASRDLGHDHEL
ncbi:MobQ family relaxase [Salipiger bermudensis]|uniref:MobQ family relaxase n=1 Tax=Salipiger bermudensis TaxID=344736 RepID=UPI00296FD6A3|nr:MobQ family relaxase [Salipiger bermudensis]